jgi:hypothetical protein
MSTPAIVKVLGPEFKERADSVIQTFLDIAALKMDPDVWGDKYNFGMAYLAAHLMAMSRREGIGGSVVREQVGEISQSFSSPISDGRHDQYLATSYGAEFLSLRNSVVITPLVRETGA